MCKYTNTILHTLYSDDGDDDDDDDGNDENNYDVGSNFIGDNDDRMEDIKKNCSSNRYKHP